MNGKVKMQALCQERYTPTIEIAQPVATHQRNTLGTSSTAAMKVSTLETESSACTLTHFCARQLKSP